MAKTQDQRAAPLDPRPSTTATSALRQPRRRARGVPRLGQQRCQRVRRRDHRRRTLLIAADRDDITPVAGPARAAVSCFPDATLEILHGVGHLIHYEVPAAGGRSYPLLPRRGLGVKLLVDCRWVTDDPDDQLSRMTRGIVHALAERRSS